VLDIYAHYAERLPQAVIEANRSAHADINKLRQEFSLLAQALDKRNLNISNHAERTDELCRAAQAKCDETIARFDALLKNIGAQVDTKAIVEGIRKTLETGINQELISPFISRSEELAKQVTPTLTKIRDAAAEAERLWSGRIWKVALGSGLLLGLTLSIVATFAIYLKFKNYYEEKVAEKIVAVEQVINYKQDAFRELAIAGVPVQVVRTSSYGVVDPSRFALIIQDADAAEMHAEGTDNSGRIFFTIGRKEEQIQQMRREAENLSGTTTERSGINPQ